MMTVLNKPKYADDDVTPLRGLMRLRIPSLTIGLALGLFLSFVMSEFREVLSKNIQLAYFIPLVVYMSDAVGNQTQSIYMRDLASGMASFRTYLIKETLLGIFIGLLFSLVTGAVVYLWMDSYLLAIGVSLGMLGAIASSPIIAMVVTEVLELENSDPAVGAGPIATAIQDAASVLIYGWVCSVIFL